MRRSRRITHDRNRRSADQGHPVDHRRHRPPVATCDHRPPGHGIGRACTPTAPTRSASTPPSWPAGREPTGITATERHRRAAGRPGPTRAATTRCGRASTNWNGCWRPGSTCCASAAWITGGKQSAGRPRPDPKGLCERGNSTIFGSGAHPGHDEHGRHGALRRRASASTRSGSPNRWTARPTSRPEPSRRWASVATRRACRQLV